MTTGSNGKSHVAALETARQMIHRGNHASAIRKLRSVLRTESEDAAARYLLGVACFETGKTEDAVAAFELAQAAHPDIPELQTNLGAAYASVGRWEDAIRVLERVLTTTPDDLRAHDNLIQIYLETGEVDAALNACETRIARAPEDPNGYFLRGNVYLMLGRNADALADYETAIELDPEDPRFHYNHGFASFAAGRGGDAERAFRTFCKLDRKSAALYAYGNAQKLFLRARSLTEQNQRLRSEGDYGGIIGVSPQMQDLFEVLERVAPRDVSVLLYGENGTGKDLFAKALHGRSLRKAGPFVALNVAAMPEELVESELFGHKKGTFSGAMQDQPGLFETASGGTLLLDEIGEMSQRAQAKVLRALEERKIRRIGERKEIEIDVRLVTATNQNLVQKVQEGTFRTDLYHRLKVIELYIPPLRERREDIRPMAQHFLAEHAHRHNLPVHHIESAAMARLETYEWPGNGRELRNAIEHAVIMAHGETITEDDLPVEIVPENRPAPQSRRNLPPDPEAEKARVLQALEDAHWHRGRAAELLGISRRHIYRLMEKYGVEA